MKSELAKELTRQDKQIKKWNEAGASKSLSNDGVMPEVCNWQFEEDNYEGDGYWKTACGRTFSFLTGSLSNNKYFYCPNCGGKLKNWRSW